MASIYYFFFNDTATTEIYTGRAAQRVAPVAKTLADAGLEPASLTLARPTLDDVFLAATGQRYDPTGEDAPAHDAARRDDDAAARVVEEAA